MDNSFKRSKDFFDSFADDYAESVMQAQPEFYTNTAKLIDRWVPNKAVMLDIGNGGVIHYNYQKLKKLVCADLSLSDKSVRRYENCPTIHFCQANIMNMAEIPNCTYDVVLVQAVIHHLAGDTFQRTNQNVACALRECMRVLREGGRLIIVESTVTDWFEKIERLLYPVMQCFFKICKFGAVYQYSFSSLVKLISNQELNIVEQEEVEVGRYIWIMKHKILRRSTPCSSHYFIIEKSKGG